MGYKFITAVVYYLIILFFPSCTVSLGLNVVYYLTNLCFKSRGELSEGFKFIRSTDSYCFKFTNLISSNSSELSKF